MRRLPSRLTLVDQVADILRSDISAGHWVERLPGEHQLSDLLQVSRSTLRKALSQLEADGTLRVSRGQSRVIVGRPGTSQTTAPNGVALVCSLPLHEQSARSIIIVDELRRLLAKAGLTLDVHVLPQFAKRTGNSRLRRLVRSTPAACWILWSCSADVQRWFARHAKPVLVQGSCHQGIQLPFFGLDLAAVCRHATVFLHRLGHRRIALLLPESRFAGTLEIENSFCETWSRLGMPSGHLMVHHIGDDPAAVETRLASLLRAVPKPTAFLVMMHGHALTTHCFLLRRGYTLPRDVSLIAILDDLYLRYATPTLTRYAFSHASFARRLSRLVIKLTRTGAIPASTTQIPDFLEGATVGPPSAQP